MNFSQLPSSVKSDILKNAYYDYMFKDSNVYFQMKADNVEFLGQEYNVIITFGYENMNYIDMMVDSCDLGEERVIMTLMEAAKIWTDQDDGILEMILID